MVVVVGMILEVDILCCSVALHSELAPLGRASAIRIDHDGDIFYVG